MTQAENRFYQEDGGQEMLGSFQKSKGVIKIASTKVRGRVREWRSANLRDVQEDLTLGRVRGWGEDNRSLDLRPMDSSLLAL